MYTLQWHHIKRGVGVDEGSPCGMSIIRNGNAALSNLSPHVVMMILGKCHILIF